MEQKNNWTEVISLQSKNKNIFREIIAHLDLLILIVRRDFVKEFKQTILGPLWFVIQPAFQTIILLFVFGKIGDMGPTGVPQVSFYLGGVIVWNVFSENLLKSSETFRANASIFGKVYFPRLIMPLSYIITTFMKAMVQFGVFMIVYFIELASTNQFQPNWTILLVPFFLILSSLAGMGVGLIISSVTTKYWDLRFLVQFGIQLLMFMSTVITPLRNVSGKGEWMELAILANPASALIEAFRFAFMGTSGGSFYLNGLVYSLLFTVLVLTIGVIVFNRVERKFMDTV